MSDSKIKFVTVELLKKGCSNVVSVEYGLFKGLKVRSDGDAGSPKYITFLLIEKQEESSILAFNLNNFNILSIGSRRDNVKELSIYKSHSVDQKTAVKSLQDFLDDLVKDKRMVKNDPEIIDVESYTNLPGAIKKTYPQNSVYNNAYNDNHNDNTNKPTEWEKKRKEKQEEEDRQEELRKTPTVFRRKGEAPGVKALNLMKKKILMISAGEYESDIVIDKEDGEDEEKNTGFVAG